MLARWQTDHVAGLLQAAHPDLHIDTVIITTRGERLLDQPLPLIGGKGVFTAEIEAALHAGEIDYAVHSLKDLPTDPTDGLTIGATPERADPADVLISRAGYTLATLPEGASVGTSSRRRAAQLLHLRPDLKLIDIRGNVDTRIGKALAADSPYDAILLAYAGVERLGRLEVVSQRLSLDQMLPAPGQGALAVQCRRDSCELLAPIQHPATAAAVSAERAFLAGLGGGCSLPIAAYAEIRDQTLHLRGRVNSPDGRQQIDVRASGDPGAAEQIGRELAQTAHLRGAAALLESLA
jgi:hydroxymethylbilane synthase